MSMEVALLCLSLNVYHEARSEPVVAQQAVAYVTLNRTRQDHDLCDVVLRRGQFSWTRTSMLNGVLREGMAPDRSSTAWRQAVNVALTTATGSDFTGGATHFHHIGVSPEWANKMTYTGTWGTHRFYREK